MRVSYALEHEMIVLVGVDVTQAQVRMSVFPNS
jgi:hypothetical protein